MINSLQSLRGIFAIMIFLSHYSLGDGERAFYQGGTMGVEFFIVLSGFVMCAGYENIVAARRISYRDFMLRRVIRLYPLHIVCLLLWLLLHNCNVGMYSLAANAVMLQAWFPDVCVYYGCNTPSWCLSVFIFLYALFPWLACHSENNPKRFRQMFVLAWIVYVFYLVCLPSNIGHDIETWATRVFPPVRLLDFALGILLWQLHKGSRCKTFATKIRDLSVVAKSLLELFTIGIYVLCAVVSERLSVRWSSEAIWWMPTVFAIMLFSMTDRCGGVISWLLNRRWLVAFGNASFCFYLLHTLVVGYVYRFCHHFGWVADDMWKMLPLMLCVTIVISMLTNRYFEEPVGKALRRLLHKYGNH